MTEEYFLSILGYENRVVLPLMTELDKPFSIVDWAFKSYVDKLIPIHNLLLLKTTESIG